MSDFSMSELRDMAPAYVLGALEADERAAFESALATSAELQQEVADFRVVVDGLSATKAVTPPPSLRARFLERIATDKPDAAPAAPAAPTAPVTPPAAAATPESTRAPEARPFTVSSGGQPAGRASGQPAGSTRGQRWWLSGALATALAASLVFAVNRNAEVNTLNRSLVTRDSVIRARDIKLAQRDSTLDTVLEAERDLVVVNLTSTPTTRGPGIQFFWNLKTGRGVIHAFRLKPAAPGRTYQVWLIKDGKPVPSKLFNSDADGHGLVWGIELPKETTGISAVAVTDEPEAGSLAPTTTPFLVGTVGPKAGQ